MTDQPKTFKTLDGTEYATEEDRDRATARAYGPLGGGDLLPDGRHRADLDPLTNPYVGPLVLPNDPAEAKRVWDQWLADERAKPAAAVITRDWMARGHTAVRLPWIKK
jgi:hypothetical protein